MEQVFGTADPKILDKISPKVARDLRYFGDAEGTYEQTPKLLKAFDKIQGAIKTGLTRLAPSFGPRQFVQNANLALLTTGLRAYRVFDPRVLGEAAALVLGTRFGSRPLSRRNAEWITKYIAPNTDEALAMREALRNQLNI
jgi:hypothetical protein